MNILIFGASGATGKELVKQALDQGHRVSAYLRNPSRLMVSHENLVILKGDLRDRALLAEAVFNKDAVLSVLGASSPFSYDRSVVNGMRHIIRAMELTTIKRFIYLSFAGVKEARDKAGFMIRYLIPHILKTEIRGHTIRERMIERSSLDWTLVRAVTLTNSKRHRSFRSGDQIRSKGFPVLISRADVATFMLEQLADDRFSRRKPLIMY